MERIKILNSGFDNCTMEEAVDAAVKENTKQVTLNLLFDLVNNGSLAREEAMKRMNLSDDEFGKGLEEYRKNHPV